MAVSLTGFFEFDSTFAESLAWWQLPAVPMGSLPTFQHAPLSRQVRGPLSADDYLNLLRNLLPYGPAWTDDPNAAVSRMFEGLSQELARIDGRCWALINEADPRSTQELFSDWQSEFGLPDPCVQALGGNQTSAQLRAALLGRINSVGGATAAYFTEVAAALGFVIRITEFLGSNTPYQWQVEVSMGKSLTQFSFASDFSEPWATWGSTLLECVMKRLAPAHTDLVFSYH